MRFAAWIAASVCLLNAAEKWTPDDLLFAETASQFRISRDGKLAVYVKSRMDKEKGEAVSHLYLKRLGETDEVQLTRGNDGGTAPQFSPDGKKIAFLSTRKAADSKEPPVQQVWMLDVRGGEPWEVTKLEKGVRAFDWIDEQTLCLAAQEGPALYQRQIQERKDTSQVVEDEKHEPPVRLYRFAIKDGKPVQITANSDRITDLEVSPDGLRAVTIHNRSLSEIYNQKIKSATFLTELATGKSVELFAGQKLHPSEIEWTADSKGFYFTAPFYTHAYLADAFVMRAYYFDLAVGSPREVNLNWENGLAGRLSVTADGFIALLANGARSKSARYVRKGDTWEREWLTGPRVQNIHAVTASPNGTELIYNYSTASIPTVWMLAHLDGAALKDETVFVSLNDAWKKKTFAKTELVKWKGAQDEEVEGILYYPHDYQPGKKYPLVVMIHGGPHGYDPDAFTDRMSYPNQLMCQRGAFVFKPNYHGSSNYGLKWSESIGGGKYNDLEWVDVEKGVDSLIARGLVDPDKMGVMGWSNGSIIAIEITTRTNRYKVASAGAGDVNWTSDWGNAVFGDSFEKFYLGATPMEDPALYIRKSPLFRMDKVKTPTIIFFGTEDRQVPTEQGWQHYRALQHYGNTDVKFILFPGEPHGPKKYVHQSRKLQEELAWFDKYLFGTASDVNEALKPDSALSAALKLKKMGDIPEVVERGAILVGRFEVTRDQFHAFDPNYKVEPGTGNYPANGITFEQAKAYCAWLAARSGKKFRLGTEEEMSPLLKPAKGQNTLDYWAGYEVNSDDTARLASLVDDLGPGTLLKPAGSFSGEGDDPVFDLGGNVAEWVVTKDGGGKVLGGSADRPVAASVPGAARSSFIGFRVVLDQ
jgi:dipeptidyl aminopeptidase/acylaminoacyl peptidase